MGICGGGRKEQAVIPIQVSEDFRNSYKDVDELTMERSILMSSEN